MEKDSETGARLFFEYTIEGNVAHFRHGQIDGKIQTGSRPFTEGKNIGKKNERTPEQVCITDTVSRARKKYEQGYEVIEGMGLIEANTGKNVKPKDLSVPKPMKAQTFKDHLKKFIGILKVFCQPKLDGNRALVNIRTAKMYSSGRAEIAHLPEIVAQVVAACVGIKDEIEWVDGELYSAKIVFEDLQSVISTWKKTDKKGLAELKEEVKFYIFDVIKDAPFDERLKYIEKIKPNSKTEIVETLIIHPDEIDAKHDEYIAQGYEGIMIRTFLTKVGKSMVAKFYEFKRSMQIFKHKLFDDAEFEVIGFKPEKHDLTKMGAAILLGDDGEPFDALPAMTDKYKAEIWANQDAYVGRRATIKFQNYTEDGKLRFPQLSKFRLPEDLTK